MSREIEKASGFSVIYFFYALNFPTRIQPGKNLFSLCLNIKENS